MLTWPPPRLAVICASAFAGAIAVLGWAPFGWMPVALVAFAMLFALLQLSIGAGPGFLSGAAFGFGLHAAGHGWMYTALHDKVGLAAPLAGFSTALYLTYLAAFTAVPCALTGFLTRRLRDRGVETSGWPVALAFASALTFAEWLRSTLFNGYTPLSIGYTTIDTWLAGFAPLGGLYLAGFAVLLLAALLGGLVVERRRVAVPLTAALAIVAGGWVLSQVEWSQPFGAPLSYRMIQANVAQARKFDPFHAVQYTRHISDLVEQAAADIIATPETAFTTFLNQLPADTLARLRRFSERTTSHVFLGIATSAANSDGYNSVMQIAPDSRGDSFARYDKMHLMPFGEYSPAGFGWFTRSLNIPMKDMSAGRADQGPLLLTKSGTTVKIGTLICQEELVGRYGIRWADSAQLVLNPTNLSWFDNSLALDQRLQIVRMRALEIARPVLRVSNTGITAQIDPRGRVVARLPVQVEGVLTGAVQATSGLTPYAQFGDGLALLLCAVGIAPVWWRLTGRRRAARASAVPGTRSSARPSA